MSRMEAYISIAEKVLMGTKKEMTSEEIWEFAKKNNIDEEHTFLNKLKFPSQTLEANIMEAIISNSTIIRYHKKDGKTFYYIPNNQFSNLSSTHWKDVYNEIKNGEEIADKMGAYVESVSVRIANRTIDNFEINIKNRISNVSRVCYGLTDEEIAEILSSLIETLRGIFVVNNRSFTLQDFEHYIENTMESLGKHHINEVCYRAQTHGSTNLVDMGGGIWQESSDSRIKSAETATLTPSAYPVNVIPSDIPTDCKDELWIFPEKFPNRNENDCLPHATEGHEYENEIDELMITDDMTILRPPERTDVGEKEHDPCDPVFNGYGYRKIEENIDLNLRRAIEHIKNCLPEKNRIIRVFVYDKNSLLQSASWIRFLNSLREIMNSPPFPRIRIYLNNEEVSL